MTDTMQKGWVYEEDGTVIYRTYSIGNCSRSLVAARLGEDQFPVHASLRAAMDSSAGLEEEVIRLYENETNHQVIWRQKEFDLDVGNQPGYLVVWADGHKRIIRCHVDGLDQNDDVITEVKTFGDNNWNAFNSGGLDALPNDLGHKYRWQAAVQGYASGRDVRFVVGHKVRDEEGNWSVSEIIREPAVPASELVTVAEIIGKIQTVEDFASRDELPDCDGGCREGDPYSEVHLFEGYQTGDEELLTLLDEFDILRNELGAEASRDKPGWGKLGRMQEVKDAIKDMCGVGKYAVGPYTARVSENKGQERVDGAWLKKNYPDVHASSLRLGKPYLVLNVKGTRQERDEEDSKPLPT